MVFLMFMTDGKNHTPQWEEGVTEEMIVGVPTTVLFLLFCYCCYVCNRPESSYASSQEEHQDQSAADANNLQGDYLSRERERENSEQRAQRSSNEVNVDMPPPAVYAGGADGLRPLLASSGLRAEQNSDAGDSENPDTTRQSAPGR